MNKDKNSVARKFNPNIKLTDNRDLKTSSYSEFLTVNTLAGSVDLSVVVKLEVFFVTDLGEGLSLEEREQVPSTLE